MALSYPITAADFFAALPGAEATLGVTDPVQVTRTRGGEALSASLGAVLWRGTVQVHRRRQDVSDAIRAMVMQVRAPGASFMVTPLHRRGPIADPTGATLGAAAVKINSLPSDPREISLKGLPAGYVLQRGDYLSFQYGALPTRQAFHQIIAGATASGNGITATMQIFPPIRPGAVVNTAVKLVAPEFKAVLDDPPDYGAFRSVFVDGIAFSFVQTLGG